MRLARSMPPTSDINTQAPQHYTSNNILQPQHGAWTPVTVQAGDTLSGLFDRLGLRSSQWRAILALGDVVAPLRHLSPGDTFRVRKTLNGHLAALHFPLTSTKTLVIRRRGGALSASVEHVNASNRHILAEGVVKQSLSAALQQAGAPARIATQLAHIFAGRIDLAQSVQPGDRFSVIYAAEFVNGSRVHTGPVIAASIHTQGRDLRAFRQMGSDHDSHYYDARGRSYQPSILRTPVNYTGVSSPFSMHRMHPILGIVRKHTGVDLAAPRGTPVHAAADGTVTYVGWISGYGRIVKLKHAMGYATRYAHMSAFADGLDEGDHVEQGQTIGYVGSSGLATGNHLHFEIRKNGVPHAPLKMALPSGKPLSGAVLTAFTNRIQPLIARLNGRVAPSNTLLASNKHFGQQQACATSGTINSVLALAPNQVEFNDLGQVFCAIDT